MCTDILLNSLLNHHLGVYEHYNTIGTYCLGVGDPYCVVACGEPRRRVENPAPF